MKKIAVLMLCAILMVSLAGCAGGSAETTFPEETFIPAADGDVLGEGANSFPLVIVDKEGNTITVTVNTDAETVGAALQNVGLLEGTQGDYGLYISAVNGIRAVYEEDGSYWAFYINDKYAMTGVDQTPITEGETYTLKVES